MVITSYGFLNDTTFWYLLYIHAPWSWVDRTVNRCSQNIGIITKKAHRGKKPVVLIICPQNLLLEIDKVVDTTRSSRRALSHFRLQSM